MGVDSRRAGITGNNIVDTLAKEPTRLSDIDNEIIQCLDAEEKM